MLPVLFKLELISPAMQAVGILLSLALVAYGAWSGWRGADTRENAPYRAMAFGVFAALVALVAAIYMAPPFGASGAAAMRVLVWVACGVLVATSALYARKVGESVASFGGIAVVASAAAVKLGLHGGVIGRSTGAPLHTYGLMIATAFLVAVWLAAREAPRAFPEGVKVNGTMKPYGPIVREQLLDLGFYVLVSALVGSRLLFVITKWDDYSRDWTQIFDIKGGLVFYGGFIGAAVASYVYCRKQHLDFLRVADVAIPSVAIGHAIGRLGCLSAGCCWGGIAKVGSRIAIRFPSARHLPFGGYGTDAMAFADQIRDHRWVDALGHLHDHAVAGARQISAYAQSTGYSLPVYPTQLMESCGELALFLLLLWVRRGKRFNGQVLATWLVLYAALRFVVELFRGDDIRNFLFKYPSELHPVILSTSQTISLGIFVTGVAIFALYGRAAKRMPAPTPEVR